MLSLAVKLLRTDPDVDRMLPMFIDFSSAGMANLAFDRMGRGGDDKALKRIFRQYFSEPEAMVDAALRMYERGDGTNLLDIHLIMRTVDLPELAAARPDLIKRARYAAQEQGWHDDFTWP